MKSLFSVVLLFMSFGSHAEYILQDVDEETTTYICSDKVKPNSTIVVLSNGGLLREAYNIGICLRDKNIKLKVMKAYSAAPYMVLFSNDVCMYPSTDIGAHTPSTDKGAASLSEVRDVLKAVAGTLINDAGIKQSVALEMIAYMIVTPYDGMGMIPFNEYTRMLGDKYKGVCK